VLRDQSLHLARRPTRDAVRLEEGEGPLGRGRRSRRRPLATLPEGRPLPRRSCHAQGNPVKQPAPSTSADVAAQSRRLGLGGWVSAARGQHLCTRLRRRWRRGRRRARRGRPWRCGQAPGGEQPRARAGRAAGPTAPTARRRRRQNPPPRAGRSRAPADSHRPARRPRQPRRRASPPYPAMTRTLASRGCARLGRAQRRSRPPAAGGAPRGRSCSPLGRHGTTSPRAGRIASGQRPLAAAQTPSSLPLAAALRRVAGGCEESSSWRV